MILQGERITKGLPTCSGEERIGGKGKGLLEGIWVDKAKIKKYLRAYLQ